MYCLAENIEVEWHLPSGEVVTSSTQSTQWVIMNTWNSMDKSAAKLYKDGLSRRKMRWLPQC